MAMNRRSFLQMCSITPIVGISTLASAGTHIPTNSPKRTVKFYLSEVDDFLEMKCPFLLKPRKPSLLKVRWIKRHLLLKDNEKLLREFFQTKGLNNLKYVYEVSRGCDNYGPWRTVEERKVKAY